MKKLIIVAVLAGALLSSNAHAQAVAPAVVGGTGTSATLFLGAMVAIPVLTYLVAENVDPWTGNFTSIEYTYPKSIHKNGV